MAYTEATAEATEVKPKKLGPQEIRYWLKELDSCEARKKIEMMKRNNYPQLIKYYEGEQKEKENGKKLAILNDYFPNVNSLLVEIMYQDPEVICEATKPFEASPDVYAKFQQSFQPQMNEMGEPLPSTISPDMVMKSALQYAMRKTDSRVENQLALFDMLAAGVCFVEVDHETEQVDMSSIEKERSGFDKFADKIKESLSPDKIEQKEAEKAPSPNSAYSLKDKTYVRRHSPLDSGIDFRADRFKDARYVYKIVRYTKAEFNVKYPDYEDKVKAGSDVPFSMHADEEHKRTIITYVIQVKRKDDQVEVYTIAPSYPYEEIDYYTRPYQTNGFNLKVGTLDKYGRLYPISRFQINKSMQDDKNNYATFMMEVAERNIPKRWCNGNKVKQAAQTALNSTKVNELVVIDGGAENVGVLPATNVSLENKELMAIQDKYSEKLWGVSKSRLGGKGDAEFMGELELQEAGFQERRLGIQEGLRRLYKEEIDTLKDIIVSFWDDAMFFKITGAQKPTWYSPQIDPLTGMVLNPLTDILTADYEVDIDIVSAMKPNKERRKKELVEYITWLTSPVMSQFLAMNGKKVSLEPVKRSASEMGLNPETLFEDLPPPVLPPEGAPIV